MNNDSFFSIGKTHQICQDYAIHHLSNNDNYIIISDGCSGSNNVDIGARILVKTQEKFFKNSNNDFDKIINYSCDIAKSLSLNETCLDATLLSAKQVNNNINVSIIGDGVFAVINNNDKLSISIIEYVSGAPLYLSYKLNKLREESYYNSFGCKKLIKTISFDNEEPKFDIQEFNDIQYEYKKVYSINDIKLLCLMSDGILSFLEQINDGTSLINEPLSFVEPLKQILSFKNYNGDFLKRRMQKFDKLCYHNNWIHVDDLSIGAMYFGE